MSDVRIDNNYWYKFMFIHTFCFINDQIDLLKHAKMENRLEMTNSPRHQNRTMLSNNKG